MSRPARPRAAARGRYKIGGSYPQNTREQNPCNCRFDSLMFLDHAATAKEVSDQYRRFFR